MTRLLYAAIALLVWPSILYQIIAFYLGSEKAINQMKASQSDFKQDNQLWLNAEPIISVLVALGFIYYGWAWAGLYVAIGTLVALAYAKAARDV